MRFVWLNGDGYIVASSARKEDGDIPGAQVVSDAEYMRLKKERRAYDKKTEAARLRSIVHGDL